MNIHDEDSWEIVIGKILWIAFIVLLIFASQQMMLLSGRLWLKKVFF
jgi:hypothetical protein